MKAFWKLTLLSLLSAAPLAQSLAQVDERVPPENLLIEYPDLLPIGSFRGSWYVARAPQIWVQDSVLDLSKVVWPKWDKAQVPLALAPPTGAEASVIVEDAKGKVLQTIPLKTPLIPDNLKLPMQDEPAFYRVHLEIAKGRLSITSMKYQWVKRKEVFQCTFELEADETLEKSGRIKTCLNTIKGLGVENAKQWYAQIQWPEQKKVEGKAFLSSWDRELRSAFRKGGHAYISDRKPTRVFKASVGVTRSELAVDPWFDATLMPKAQGAVPSATREEIKKTMFETTLSDGSQVGVSSFASDAVDDRSKNSPSSFKTRVNIQFIAGTQANPIVKETEFKEARTGVAGIFRPWRGAVYGTANQLVSSRGEQASFGNGPGFEFSYNWAPHKLVPYLKFESGLFHPGSSLFITELEAGAKRHFEFLPQWSSLGLGYQQYQLAGQNPGSARLGKVDALNIGLYGRTRGESSFMRAQVRVNVSTAIGFDTQFEFGRVFGNLSDIPYTGSVFIGFSRYAATTETRLKVTETFTEDRFKLGISFGFDGPDSE